MIKKVLLMSLAVLLLAGCSKNAELQKDAAQTEALPETETEDTRESEEPEKSADITEIPAGSNTMSSKEYTMSDGTVIRFSLSSEDGRNPIVRETIPDTTAKVASMAVAAMYDMCDNVAMTFDYHLSVNFDDWMVIQTYDRITESYEDISISASLGEGTILDWFVIDTDEEELQRFMEEHLEYYTEFLSEAMLTLSTGYNMDTSGYYDKGSCFLAV